MKSYLIFILSVKLLVGCSKSNRREIVELNHYNSTLLGEKLSSLSKVEDLTIKIDSVDWIIGPPCSGMFSYNSSPPYNELPSEITQLRKLISLNIAGLSLKRLPDNFSDLRKLRTLNLTLNKMDITNELPKLELLNLDTLIITGNRYDTTQLTKWRQKHPNTRILDNCAN